MAAEIVSDIHMIFPSLESNDLCAYIPHQKNQANLSSVAKWRIPIGQSGLLHIFLQIIATEGVEHTLMTHALRLIGNSCADTGESITSSMTLNQLNSEQTIIVRSLCHKMAYARLLFY